ncbi:MAG TPA: hypothetical protein VK465_00680 [Fibrobacteria bacterium]|nr:hypothetical protein [Fibrobacteria bacterium]
MKGFENARKLERLELDILMELRKTSPGTDRAFPVSIQQWGQGKLEVNGIYATNRGEFYFIDFGASGGLTVRGLETKRALDMVNLMSHMGVVGNRSSLSELVFADSAVVHPPILPPPPAKDADASAKGAEPDTET